MPPTQQSVPKNYLLPEWLLLVLFVAYALPGNLWHAPWRGDDVVAIDVATRILRHGEWLTPSLAGSPHLEWWPPLSAWLGAVLGLMFGWIVPEHDAIRMTSVLSLGVTLWCLRETCRRLYGTEAAHASLLISLGSLGLLVHAHEAQPMMLLLAAVSATLYGLVVSRDQARRGAVIAGISAGAAFLAAGLAGSLLTLPLWLVMPAICKECRAQGTAANWGIALGIALILTALWPLSLALSQPSLLADWWRAEWRDILPHASHLSRFGQLSSLLAWFAWPLWPVAAWSLWRQRKQLCEFRLLLPLTSLVLALWLISTTGSLRNANALPILPPLILLAAAELPKLRRGAINFFDWFGVVTFSMVIAFVWLSFAAVHLGWPRGLSRNISLLAQGYEMPFSLTACLIAALLTTGWIASIVRMPFFQLRGAVHWALGVTLAWGVTSVLWQPWLDYTKNYAPISKRIKQDMASSATPDCLGTLGAGAAQHAALDYFEDIQPVSMQTEPYKAERCANLLVYGSGRNHTLTPVANNWNKAWTVKRGRGRAAETFVLYQRSK